MTDKAAIPKLILIDAVEGINVAQSDYHNEIVSLRTQINGLKRLCGMVKSRELAFEKATEGKLNYFQFGGTGDEEKEPKFITRCVTS